MPKFRRDLTGKELISAFAKLGFAVVEQRGSHVKIKRNNNDQEQTLTIPIHKEIDVGTARAIFNQALRFIPADDLRNYFYTK